VNPDVHAGHLQGQHPREGVELHLSLVGSFFDNFLHISGTPTSENAFHIHFQRSLR